jgi:hypothetical protein
MKVFRSMCYGWGGAILAGLLVAIVGVTFGVPQNNIVAAAAPTGVVMGLMGLSLPWARPVLARIRAGRR